MITLKHVRINKYKSIETEQNFAIDEKVTTIVGKNESGKTAILEAIAKSNYFVDDPKFKFNPIFDYPRKEKKQFDKAETQVEVISCTYHLSEELLNKIQAEVGPKNFIGTEITYAKKYLTETGTFGGVHVDLKQFLAYKLGQNRISSKEFVTRVSALESTVELNALISETSDEPHKTFLEKLRPYFVNSWNWENNPISEYVARVIVKPHMPKFLYYDEYYELPSEIEIKKLQNEQLEDEKLKTSKALFELADINIKELINDDDYEPYKAELEATANAITAKLFEYWQTNNHLRVDFDIKKVVIPRGNQAPEINPSLMIRVYNQKYMMSLPLASRSKGFNWFFSFIVWFSKIQEDKKSNYIILLDEPGLNLHATAQEDLRRFIEDLSKDYQIIYTTHSPFMVDSSKLHRVRTVLETDKKGTKVSDSIQEKDPDTLFPLQAALGYDIAQNLFISKNNLLIEGVSDLLYLTIISGILQGAGRSGLRDNITLIPVGGLDKVTSFISLLRGQKLKIACLLDTFTDQKGKKRISDLVQEKIIREKDVRFFDEFVSMAGREADLEDLFEKEEYLNLFNTTFSEHRNLALTDLDSNQEKIILQINHALGIQRFNHYRPANELAKIGPDISHFSTETLSRFEAMFIEINKLF